MINCRCGILGSSKKYYKIWRLPVKTLSPSHRLELKMPSIGEDVNRRTAKYERCKKPSYSYNNHITSNLNSSKQLYILNSYFLYIVQLYMMKYFINYYCKIII